MVTPCLINRDISWLSFNHRVLEEAKDKTLPIYERIKFLAIYSSNLDEFYKVRVAYYRNLQVLSNSNKKKLGFDPERVLQVINTTVNEQITELMSIFYEDVIPELRKNGIYLYQDEDLLPLHQDFTDTYFSQEILPHIQPVLLDKGGVFSFLQDNVEYLAVKILRKNRKNKLPEIPVVKYAIIKLPTQHLPRFIELPHILKHHYIIFLDDIIRLHLDMLFPGYVVDSCYSIKLSRNADILIDDEYHGDLADKIKKSLAGRKTGAPSRFLYDKSIPKDFLRLLMQVFKLSKSDLVEGGRYQNFSDLFAFPNPLKPKLEVPTFERLQYKKLEKFSSMFEAIKEKDWMVHFPYQSYRYVLNFLNEAAIDPKVVEIKTTQYRVATNSAVVSALISAARNGKKVTVFVEVKARFDEENNLFFAEEMRKAGITVISSLPEIKVHAKLALVLRKSSTDHKKLRSYSYISTGNFNEKTAKIYADHGFFTYNQEIGNEINTIFDYFENPNHKPDFKHLLVAQFNMNRELKRMITREIQAASKGKRGYIILKLNSLEEPKIIEKLYEASQKGVQIDLIVRGICCIIPNQAYSKNIRVIRIVDRFLEHARIYVFHNNGKNDTYISSADWMNRNLYRRIEVATPIYDEAIKTELLDMLNLQLNDNVKACTIDENQNNIPVPCTNGKHIRSQMAIYEYLKNKNL